MSARQLHPEGSDNEGYQSLQEDAAHSEDEYFESANGDEGVDEEGEDDDEDEDDLDFEAEDDEEEEDEVEDEEYHGTSTTLILS